MGIALSGRYKLYPLKKHLRSYFTLQGTELRNFILQFSWSWWTPYSPDLLD